MKFETTRFGSIEVNSDEIFVFPDGLLGFPECTRYIFIDEEGTAPFRRMQSLDNAALAFVVIDPLSFKQDYSFQITKDDLAMVKSEDTQGLVVYAIVTMAKYLKDVTVNLQGPLVINPSARLGHQFVLVNEEYTTRESLLGNGDVLMDSKNQEPSRQVITKAS